VVNLLGNCGAFERGRSRRSPDGSSRRFAVIGDRNLGVAVGELVHVRNYRKPVREGIVSAEHMLPLTPPMLTRFSPASATARIAT